MEILEVLEQDKLNRHKNGLLFNQIDVNAYYYYYNYSRNNIRWNNMYYCNDTNTLRQKEWVSLNISNSVCALNKYFKSEEMGSNLIDDKGYKNFVVAGGFFTHHELEEVSDIDIFIYNNYEDTLKNLINFFIKYKRYYFSRRTKYFVQLDHLLNKRPVIQIILRKYTTISEILYSFDIGASQICYNGKTLYYTILSKFSIENRVNIFDTSRLSPTYEWRLSSPWTTFR